MLKCKIMYRCFLLMQFCCFCIINVNAQILPYKNKNLSTAERVEDLLSRMTLEEKIAQLNMTNMRSLKIDSNGNVPDSLLSKLFKGRSIGCIESPFIEHERVAIVSEAVDEYLRKKTRLGIPVIKAGVCLHGHLALGTTIFPQAIGLGSTWNPELIKEMSSVIAEEASLAGVDQALDPLFDLARDPRYGRTEECYGEDPFLVKEMGKAYVIGMQGNPEQSRIGLEEGKIACTAKHYVAYSVPQTGLNLAPALLGERSLREDHLVPFETAVKEANVYSIMPGYHEVDGIPLHANRWLLTDILRNEWKFGGYVISDYGAISMMNRFHKTAEGPDEAAIQALNAGVDVEAPSTNAFKRLADLVNSGRLEESVIDTAVKRILSVKFKMGLFDRPFVKDKDSSLKIHKKSSVELSQRIAEESIVLLKNSNNLLPLNKSRLKTIAVIGPNADDVQFGDYTITKDKSYGVTLLQGLKKYLDNDINIKYAKGCDLTKRSKEGFAEAAKIARESDVVLLVLGGTSKISSGIGWGDPNSKFVNTSGEGFDRNELNFPGVQPELLDIVASQGKPVVLVMLNGRPYTITEEVKKVDAILEAWYPGEKGGDAITRILFGEVNPSGKLSVSFPRSVGHIPVYSSQKPSARGYYGAHGSIEKPGRDYVFSSPTPLFCFGHGLSYTSFEYSNIQIKNNTETGGKISISFTLKNIGKYKGAEVAQLYVRDVISSTTTPVKSLKGFKKIYLSPNESRDVTFELSKEDLKLWDSEMNYVFEPGEFIFYIGSSIQDIRLKMNVNVN